MSEKAQEINHNEERYKRLEPFVRQCLDHQNLKVVNYEATKLLPPGRNYSSAMIKLNVVVRKHGDTKEEKIYLAMKTNAWHEKPYLNWAKSFEKESFMYVELLPTYRELQREAGFEETELIDTTPKHYGTKYGVRGDSNYDNINEDLGMLMENLEMHGYYRIHKKDGYNMEDATKTLTTLAKFHAMGIVMKHRRPDFAKIAFKNFQYDPYHPIVYDRGFRSIFKTFSSNPSLAKYEDYLKSSLKLFNTMLFSNTYVPQEPWASISHGDFWLNNILLHKDKNDKVDNVKFVDYKSSVYSSPLLDLPYFMCGNLQEPVLNDNFDDLLDLHYNTFIKTLERCNIDTTSYSRSSFDCDLKKQAHLIFAFTVMLIKFTTFDDIKDKEKDKDLITSLIFGSGTDLYVHRLVKLIEVYERKDWISLEYSC